MRPLYRVLAAVAGGYVLAFGVVGLLKAGGKSWFDRSKTYALGLRTNLAFALASVVTGRSSCSPSSSAAIWTTGNLLGGVGFMVIGTAMLALISTDLNVLNFSIETVMVSYLVGMLLFSAGLYGRSRPLALS